jgi:hypothetical protein
LAALFPLLLEMKKNTAAYNSLTRLLETQQLAKDRPKAL